MASPVPAEKVLSGTKLSDELKATLKTEIAAFHGSRKACLATVLVGSNPGSVAYVSMKTKACAAVGIETLSVELPETVTQEELLAKVKELNMNNLVDGILLQLPLPRHINQFAVVETIDPKKDVDALTSSSAGLLAVGCEDRFVSCTPFGIIKLLERTGKPLRGADAVIINHSTVVGRPLGQLLLNRGVTVTTCHVDTVDLASHTRRADIVISAVGRPGLIKGDMIKEGAIVIDAGFARVNNKVCGDTVLEEVAPKVSMITPPTGGVGPMTIAMLCHNTWKAFLMFGQSSQQ
eukprot:TRINITY_DN6831_c0_g1_i1.p2 TRINITY_DN6831_c0_g1~~TRINITY_DN6831_c0_g1_i1.p2  ORF type:complete len:292 (-),score=86.79 TRINITY_DN6831_c0_g1_i1:44-919(-)